MLSVQLVVQNIVCYSWFCIYCMLFLVFKRKKKLEAEIVPRIVFIHND